MRNTRVLPAARNPTGNTVPSVSGTSPNTSPTERVPTTCSMPSTIRIASIPPSRTPKSARSSPTWTA